METNLLTMTEMIERLSPLKIKTRQSFYQKFGHRIKPVRREGNKNFYSEDHVQALIKSELSNSRKTSTSSNSLDIISVVNGRILNDLMDEKQRLRDENVLLGKKIESMDEALACLNAKLEATVPRLEYHKRIEELECAQQRLQVSEKNVMQLTTTLENVCKEREQLRLKAENLRKLKAIQSQIKELNFFSYFKRKALEAQKALILSDETAIS